MVRCNYFKANDDKCHLLVTNHSDEISLLVGKELIKGSKSVKLRILMKAFIESQFNYCPFGLDVPQQNS